MCQPQFICFLTKSPSPFDCFDSSRVRLPNIEASKCSQVIGLRFHTSASNVHLLFFGFTGRRVKLDLIWWRIHDQCNENYHKSYHWYHDINIHTYQIRDINYVQNREKFIPTIKQLPPYSSHAISYRPSKSILARSPKEALKIGWWHTNRYLNIIVGLHNYFIVFWIRIQSM